MKGLIRFLAFEATVFAFLFLPPYFLPPLWWPANRITVAVILSIFAYLISGGSSKGFARRMAYIIGILAVIYSWYRMGQSYEDFLNVFAWLFPTFLLGLSLADIGIVTMRRFVGR